MITVRKFLLGFALIASMSFPPQAHSAESGRTKNRVGIYAGAISSDPVPTPLGVNLAWNTFSFLRLYAGAGVYDAIVWNPFIGVYNYTLAPLFAFLIEVITLGLVDAKMKDFQASYFHAGEKQLFAYGGGAKLFLIPWWSFSPTIGAGYSLISTNTHYNGLNPGKHKLFYGSAGFDFTGENGVHVGFGANYSRKLQAKFFPYISFGFFF